MHEEAQEAGHHIASQPCLSDHVGQAWTFDEWDRIKVPETNWCLSAPIVSGIILKDIPHPPPPPPLLPLGLSCILNYVGVEPSQKPFMPICNGKSL